MCGIVGVVRLDGGPAPSPGLLEEMAAVLRHRGPDDAGIYRDHGIGLAHRRLSIIDLSPMGRQPMTNEDDRLWIVYNGEVYNYRELLSELMQRGHRIVSRSDTAAVLHAYEEWGEACLDRFNGMFAFAIWDRVDRTLFLARDRLGVKPLYYFLDAGLFIFASEIKAILQHPEIDASLDWASLGDYFALNYIPAPRTPFNRIRSLLPGHALTVRDSTAKIRRYWDVSFGVEEKSDEEYTREVTALVEQAVERRLVADVPVGAFLSGGLDSSTIAYFTRIQEHSSLKTFSVGFQERSYDETPYAELVARRFGTEHHTVICSPQDLVNGFERVVWHADSLVADISNLPLYKLSELASQHVKVVLSGDGGDEIFGGYLTYQADLLAGYYRRLPASIRGGLSSLVSAALRPSSKKQSLEFKVKKFIEGAALPPGRAHYSWRTIFTDPERAQLFAGDYREVLATADPFAGFSTIFETANAVTDLDRCFYTDLKVFLVDSILAKVDRMTMGFSLEARTPFLDYTVVEYMARVPSRLKVKGFRTKILLKNAMAVHLPQEIVHRGKAGFHTPLADWFRGALKDFVNDQLNGDDLRALGIFNVAQVERLKQQHFTGQENHAFKLWGLMNFVVWHRLFVTSRNPQTSLVP